MEQSFLLLIRVDPVIRVIRAALWFSRADPPRPDASRLPAM